MRPPRDFRPQQLYAVTQRGNAGQWVHRDREDFEEARRLMIRYAGMHQVNIHFYIQLHNHSHWVFEASDGESISNLMRDMQGNYSRYLNRKYRKKPWLLRAPLLGAKRRKDLTRYLPDAPHQTAATSSPDPPAVAAGLVKRAKKWRWSSAAAHCTGTDEGGVLCLDRWQWFFGNPETIVEEWERYLEGPREERQRNAGCLAAMPHNRPRAWSAPVADRTAGATSGGLPD